jgi:DNA transformation protein
MFGGAGLFADGVMFGLVSGGQIYLKADATTVTCFEREQCGPFEYSTKNGKRTLTSYWRLPDRLYDDADELAQWARQALAAARQGAAVKPRAGKRRFNIKLQTDIARPIVGLTKLGSAAMLRVKPTLGHPGDIGSNHDYRNHRTRAAGALARRCTRAHRHRHYLLDLPYSAGAHQRLLG